MNLQTNHTKHVEAMKSKALNLNFSALKESLFAEYPMYKVQSEQKLFYPFQLGRVEQKATNNLLSGRSKDQHFCN